MKELSIEEKAKAYDEAINVAEKYHNGTLKDVMETIFPELKESEDKKPNGAIVMEDFNEGNGFYKVNLAYLNKEQVEDIENIIKRWNVQKYDEEAIRDCIGVILTDAPEQRFLDFNTSLKDCLAWLEKQAQKPDDKVEPIFNVGDWVVNTVGDTNQVIKVFDDGYVLDDNTFISNSWTTEHYHLWTIQDAKDGDVLATDDGNIFVFDGTVEEAKYPFAYYGLTRRRFVSYGRRLPFTHNNVHPATKEQRGQLEKAMADAGYTFDFEKNKLKKIEQKPAWSEDDERKFSDILALLWGGVNRHYDAPDLSTWFKSLKERYAWKPSELQLECLNDAIKHYQSNGSRPIILVELLKDLKKLK